MKTCVSSYSFGSYISDEKLGMKGIIDKAAEMGFEGFEFVEGDWTKGLDLETARGYGEYARSKGLVCVSYCIGANFLCDDLDAEIARVKKEVDFAAALGVMNMRHDTAYGFSGDKKYSIGFDDALPIIIKGARAVTEYAATKGVGTMTENHGYFAQDSDRVEKIVNGVAHPNFGALCDVGNFMCADEVPYHAVGIMARYAKHVHAKDFFFRRGTEFNPGQGWFTTRGGNYLRGTIVGHGDAGVPQSLNILKNAGYDGFVSIEFEGIEDNLLGIKIGLENLKRFIG
ncbi:MAG: sugar phosphate isomerase/epimerase family protein [Eubacteriales bacterium]